MTQSHPFLDPPSNGKCLDSKEAADEGLCQREACLGWVARGSKSRALLSLWPILLRLLRQRQLYYQSTDWCIAVTDSQAMQCAVGTRGTALAVCAISYRILPLVHGAMAKPAGMMRAAQQEPCVSSSPQPAYRQQHRS
jgi:hypothetical protein